MASQKITVHRITNANIYLGDTNLLGRATEIKLPDIKAIMSEHKALGMIGKIELPTGGFDKLEGEIKWNSFYEETWKSTLNVFSSIALQCRSSIDMYDSTGRSQQKSLVTHLTVTFSENPLGTYKQNENAEFSSKFTATSVRQLVDGKEVLNIDYLANIFEVGGQDQIATYREIIGG